MANQERDCCAACRSRVAGAVPSELSSLDARPPRELEQRRGRQRQGVSAAQLDYSLPDSSGPSICDFKTASKSGQRLELAHEVQLSCYAWLFRHNSPEQEAGLEIRCLIKTKQPQVQFHVYEARSDQHFRRLFALIRAYVDALDAGRFVYRPGRECSTCEFRDRQCRAWPG